MGTIIQRARLVMAQIITPPPPPPPPPPGGTGRPFAVGNGWATDTTLQTNTDNFSASFDGYNTSTLLNRIPAARAAGKQLLITMTGGSHDNYWTTSTSQIFSLAKWKAKMDTFAALSAGNKAIINAAVADGTILGNSMIDEPANGSWNGGTYNGTVTTVAMMNEMADYARAIFPTMPQGLTIGSEVHWKEPALLNHLDFVNFQWSTRHTATYGSVSGFRDAANGRAATDGFKVHYSINVLNGGTRITGCPQPETGGAGLDSPNCKMTPQQIIDYCAVLGPAGIGIFCWRYDTAFMALQANKDAFKAVKDAQALRTTLSWLRGV